MSPILAPAAPDGDVWRSARDHQAVLVTRDEDFANMIAIGGDTPSVVWVRVGTTRRAALLAWFEPLIDQIVGMIEAGNRLIELR